MCAVLTMAAKYLTLKEFKEIIEWTYDRHREGWEEFKVHYRVEGIPVDDDFVKFNSDLKTGQGTAAKWFALWCLQV